MSLAEGVQATVAYKAYATGVITANTKATSSSDPGASGGQLLRRVSSSLKFQKDTYKSAEVRADRQIADARCNRSADEADQAPVLAHRRRNKVSTMGANRCRIVRVGRSRKEERILTRAKDEQL